MNARFVLMILIFTLSIGAQATAADECFDPSGTRDCTYYTTTLPKDVWCIDGGVQFYPFPTTKNPNGLKAATVRCGTQRGSPSIALLEMHRLLLTLGLTEKAVVELLKGYMPDSPCGEFILLEENCTPAE